jgi:hypothetical protein
MPYLLIQPSHHSHSAHQQHVNRPPMAWWHPTNRDRVVARTLNSPRTAGATSQFKLSCFFSLPEDAIHCD